MEFKRTPLHYWHEYLNPDKEARVKPDIITKANPLEFGNAFHSYVLEPSEFDKRYMVFEKQDGRTSAGKAANAQAALLQGNRELIDAKAFREITNMSRSINSQPMAKGMIDGAVYEKSLFWIDADTGILCKVRPDIWHENMCVDLKSSGDASYRAFSYDAIKYGYDLQCAMMSEAIKSLTEKDVQDFIFVVVEKTAPYATACYKLDVEMLNIAKAKFKAILFEMKECMVSGKWPGYSDNIITMPVWKQNGDLT
jgi:hypothetical protein